MLRLFRLILVQIIYFLLYIQSSAEAFEYNNSGFSTKPDIELHLEVLESFRNNIESAYEAQTIKTKEEVYPLYCGNQYKYKDESNKYNKNHPNQLTNESSLHHSKIVIAGHNLPDADKMQKSLSTNNAIQSSTSSNQSLTSKSNLPMIVIDYGKSSEQTANHSENVPNLSVNKTTANADLNSNIKTPNIANSKDMTLNNIQPATKDNANTTITNGNKMVNNINNQDSSAIPPVQPIPSIPPLPKPPVKTTDSDHSVTTFPKPFLAPGPVINPNIGNKNYQLNFKGSTNLSKDIEKKLNVIANNLRNNSSSILKIIGYVKESNGENTKVETRSASLKRVIAIRNYLVNQGIPTTRLVVQAGIVTNKKIYNEVEIEEVASAENE